MACAALCVPRPRHHGAPGRITAAAATLADLHGPATGKVELPLHLFWSAPSRTFDLDDEDRRRSMYETVLQSARQPGDLAQWLNPALLVALWPRLRLTPRSGIRAAWEARNPVLRTPAA